MSSPTLRERAFKATLIAKDATQQQGQELLAGSVEQLAMDIEEETRRATEIAAGLKEAGIQPPKSISAGREAVLTATRRFLDEPINANLEKSRDSLRFLRSTIDETQKLVEEAWSLHRQANPAPSIDRSYLDQLSSAGFDISAIEASVERHDARLMLLGERPVPRPGDREAWDVAVRDLRQASDDLARLAPPEVRAFLSAAVGSGAPMELLTRDVLQFLTERGLDTSFRVVRR